MELVIDSKEESPNSTEECLNLGCLESASFKKNFLLTFTYFPFLRNRERPIFVNLSKVVEMIKKGRLDNSKLITIRSLYEANLFKRAHYGVKILSRVGFSLNLEPFFLYLPGDR